MITRNTATRTGLTCTLLRPLGTVGCAFLLCKIARCCRCPRSSRCCRIAAYDKFVVDASVDIRWTPVDTFLLDAREMQRVRFRPTTTFGIEAYTRRRGGRRPL